MLCSTPVHALLPCRFNSSDGLMRGVETGLSDDEIRRYIPSPYHVHQAKSLVANTSLPASVKLGYISLSVFPYKERALICYHASTCDHQQLCPRCAASHEGSCTIASPHCTNCGKSHIFLSFVSPLSFLPVKKCSANESKSTTGICFQFFFSFSFLLAASISSRFLFVIAFTQTLAACCAIDTTAL